MKTKSPALKNRPIGMKPSWAVFNIKLELAREIIYNCEDKSLETKFQKQKKKKGKIGLRSRHLWDIVKHMESPRM